MTESSVGQTVSMSLYSGASLGLEFGEMKHDMMVNPRPGSDAVDVTWSVEKKKRFNPNYLIVLV